MMNAPNTSPASLMRFVADNGGRHRAHGLEVTVHGPSEGATVVRVVGEADLASARTLKEALQSAVSS